MNKTEFFKKNYIDGLNTLNALDEIDDETAYLYTTFESYRSESLPNFLRCSELFNDEEEAVEFMLWKLERIIEQANSARDFLQLRQETMQEEE